MVDENENESEIAEITAIGILRGTAFHPQSGLFDDAYPLELELDDRLLMASSDMVVGGTDRLPGMSLESFARKAVASTVSDVSVKGAKPMWFLTSVGVPKDEASEETFAEIRDGLARASLEFDVQPIGGDVSSAPDIVMDVTVMGKARRFIGRSGGRKGDFVFVAGWGPGYTWLGYALLFQKVDGGLNISEGKKREAVEYLYNPKPPVEFNVAAAEFIDASIDSSDGVAFSLYELALQSGLDLTITSLPADDELVHGLEDVGLDPVEATFYGGEEYVEVGLVCPESVNDLEIVSRETHTPFRLIGRATETSTTPLVSLTLEGSKPRILENRGWSHYG